MKVRKSDVVIFIQIMLFLIPSGLIRNPVWRILWYGALAISMACIIYGFIVRKRITGGGSVLLPMALYQITQCVMTYLNNGDWIYGIFTSIVICCFIAFMDDEIQRNTNSLIIFDKALLATIVMEMLGHIFDYPYLMDFGCVYVYYGVWSVVRLINKWNKKERDYSLYGITCLLILATLVKNESAESGLEWTFFVMCILMCLLYLFRSLLYKWGRFINVIWFYAGISIFNLSVVILHLQDRIPLLKFIIEDVMHKDITFTGRTEIWAFARGLISQRPLIGYGGSFASLPRTNGYWYSWMQTYGPHNQFLAVMMTGGMITFAVYVRMVFLSTKSLLKCKRSPVSVIIVVGLIAIYLELTMTYRNMLTCIPLFGLFCISKRIALLTERKRDGKEKKLILQETVKEGIAYE